MKTSRRQVLGMLLGWSAVAGLLGARALAAPGERVIKIGAKAFEYVPKEITLKRGEPVLLELTSADLVHGFSCSEFGVRADLPPKQTVRLRVVPKNAGEFEFHCDNFCGSGHEEMNGVFRVQV